MIVWLVATGFAAPPAWPADAKLEISTSAITWPRPSGEVTSFALTCDEKPVATLAGDTLTWKGTPKGERCAVVAVGAEAASEPLSAAVPVMKILGVLSPGGNLEDVLVPGALEAAFAEVEGVAAPDAVGRDLLRLCELAGVEKDPARLSERFRASNPQPESTRILGSLATEPSATARWEALVEEARRHGIPDFDCPALR